VQQQQQQQQQQHQQQQHQQRGHMPAQPEPHAQMLTFSSSAPALRCHKKLAMARSDVAAK
jgi:hypothetical protein